MKRNRLLIVAAGVCLLSIGLGLALGVLFPAKSAAASTGKPRDENNDYLLRYRDAELGVVCYRLHGFQGIACVKEKP
jgi:hypothetical protein